MIAQFQYLIKQQQKKIMNLKPKPIQTNKQIQILDRKTDDHGRTIYLVNWGHLGKNCVWQPMGNLMDHYQVIRQYQRNYQERVKNWNEQVQYYDAWGQSISQRSLGKQQEKMEMKQKTLVYENINNKYITELSDSSANDDQIKITPTPDFAPIPSTKQITSKANIESQKKQPAQHQNQQQKNQVNKLLAVSLKKSMIEHNLQRQRQGQISFKVKGRKRIQRQYREIKLEKIVEIVDIFVESGIWYAIVRFQNIGQKQVLRDWLRVEEPEMLLLFYEKLVQLKKKESFINF